MKVNLSTYTWPSLSKGGHERSCGFCSFKSDEEKCRNVCLTEDCRYANFTFIREMQMFLYMCFPGYRLVKHSEARDIPCLDFGDVFDAAVSELDLRMSACASGSRGCVDSAPTDGCAIASLP